MKMKPILFLDFDGVLCLDGLVFAPHAVANLLKIIAQVDCDIVLSTSWRTNPDWGKQVLLSCAGLDTSWMGRIVGKTPDFSYPQRVEEITWWVSNNICKRFVVVDDEDLQNLPHFVRTKPRCGLDKKATTRVISEFRLQK